jgi:tetratricopeptide (TPR) repeat protein
MRFSFVADHFQYHASYALLILAAAGLTLLFRRLVAAAYSPAAPRFRALAAGLPCAVLGALTWSRCRAFSDAETLWHDTLAKNDTSWAAYSHLAAIDLEEGRTEDAHENFLLAARHCPFPSEAWADAAYVHIERGDIDAALALYEPVLRAHPVAAERVVAIADQLMATERRADATHLYELLAERVPDYAPGRVAYGDALFFADRLDEARAQYEAALELEPDGPRAADACFGLGAANARRGDFHDAIPHLERAVALRPKWDKARRALQEARRRASEG